MNTRLKQFLAAENITQAQFADTIKVVRASVSHVLSGRNNPSYEFIRSIMLHYPNLNIEWLMFGKGRMYKENAVTEEDYRLFEYKDSSNSNSDLFSDDMDSGSDVQESDNEAIIQPAATVVNTQRKVSKIIVLFDDGSYQEM